jgi:large subunit ribosomal protein L47
MGRSWKAEELMLKSDEDLHKLWHLLLIEKNLLMSDNALKRKIHGTIGA